MARNIVSKAALCKAKKLKPEAFVELNTKTVKYFYQHAHPLTWNVFFLETDDSSTVTLPDCPEIVEHCMQQFGARMQYLDNYLQMRSKGRIEIILISEDLELQRSPQSPPPPAPP
ncbi:hypothetical protein [uncultured Desulfobulbus sp.]|uniref:hypothetical protein n=1 Tax=uncultured Desulfobulbus sp. TaxID=239745 RepID=UPI0029C90A99|nr:hypothetical protein [uncultured Desulfobulbus sp.]